MKTIFDFRAFLNFLGRNKLYTAINIFGFSVSLMFVILLVTYTRQEYAVTRKSILMSAYIPVMRLSPVKGTISKPAICWPIPIFSKFSRSHLPKATQPRHCGRKTVHFYPKHLHANYSPKGITSTKPLQSKES